MKKKRSFIKFLRGVLHIKSSSDTTKVNEPSESPVTGKAASVKLEEPIVPASEAVNPQRESSPTETPPVIFNKTRDVHEDEIKYIGHPPPDSVAESASSGAKRSSDTDCALPLGISELKSTTAETTSKRLTSVEISSKGIDDKGIIIPGIQRTFTAPIAQDSQATRGNIHNDTDREEFVIFTPVKEPLSRQTSVRSSISYSKHSNQIFPEKIKCLLNFTFEENPKFEPCEIPDFLWYEAKSYTVIDGTISKAKDLIYEKAIAKQTHEIYLRYASCFVKGEKNQRYFDADSNVLIDSMDILPDVSIRAICGFINRYPFQPFVLQIYCDFSSIKKIFTAKDDSTSWPQENSPFHYALRKAFDQKMNIGKETIGSQKYLSLADQQNLVTYQNARRIIDEDALSDPPRLTPAQKSELIDTITKRPAITLHAACVYELLPMKVLYHFLCEHPHLSEKLSDSVEKLRENAGKQCGAEPCDENWVNFFKSIDRFFPETIRSDFEHSVKNDSAIMPVRYVNKDIALGSGAFSTVWEVDVDPHYQLLTPDIAKTYALKRFKTEPQYKAAFDREIKMLLRLARYLPHEHILTHITSWEQKKVYYILYEKAHGNLRKHMEEFPHADLSKDRILWFFSQLRGLADAVRRIHFFRETDVDPETGEVNDKKTGVVGRHHDIKPENILCFDLPRELPTLKISDFGSGKFSSVRAFNQSPLGATEVRATRTYAGPESHTAMHRPMSRPFDLWALGCVFLELLLWFLGIERPNGKDTFAEMRSSEQFNAPSPVLPDYFWARDSLGFFIIHPVVKYVLRKLESEYCVGMEAFQELTDLIKQLLVIEPRDRLSALMLFNGLDAILVKTQVELDRQPTMYAKIFENNKYPNPSSDPASYTSPSLNIAPLTQLNGDLSTTGESRVESATDLQRYDSPGATLRPPLSGGTMFPELEKQFPSAGLGLHTSDENHDDEDAMYLRDSAQGPSNLMQEFDEDIKALRKKSER